MIMFLQVVGAFIATVTFSIVIGVPKKFIVNSGLVGGIGWFVNLWLNKLGFDIVFRFFMASLVVALISHSCARLRKSPVTVFLIPGIIPLVPGTAIYRMVYNMIMNEGSRGSYYFVQTLQLAGVIAVAIFIMDTFFRIFQK